MATSSAEAAKKSLGSPPGDLSTWLGLSSAREHPKNKNIRGRKQKLPVFLRLEVGSLQESYAAFHWPKQSQQWPRKGK